MKRSRSVACLAAIFVALHTSAIPNAVLSAAAAPGGAPRVVNITADSPPGWMPSEDLERQARKTATDFLANMDSGKYAEAYALLSELQRKEHPFSSFAGDLRKFNASAGAVLERRIVTVTWTKDSPRAPLRGVYVALDLVSRFAKIDRHCGYVVLHQAPAGGPFRVASRENNYMPNDVAAIIAKKSSPAAVDSAWAKLAAHCPGYNQRR